MTFSRAYTFRWRHRRSPVTVSDYRRLARRALPTMPWTFLENGAEDEITLRRNRSDFDGWQLRQRILTGKAGTDLTVEVAGVRLDLPVVLAPTGLGGLFHWRGEVAAARAAERCGTRHVSSTGASYRLDEVAEGTREAHWFQLYPWADRDLMRDLVGRATRAGVGVLLVTVDVPVVGNREREKRAGMGTRPVLTPVRVLEALRHPRWLYGYARHRRYTMVNVATGRGARSVVTTAARQFDLLRPDLLSWDTLSWLRDLWPGPLLVKGVMDPDDASRVMDIGCEGVVVSNHGGRQLDGQGSSVEAIAAVVDAMGGRGSVLVDGGVRRGTDVVKALCLGADACLIGRPYLYGLAARGEDGVVDILGIFRREIETALTLMGCAGVGELDRSRIERTRGPVGTHGGEVSW